MAGRLAPQVVNGFLKPDHLRQENKENLAFLGSNCECTKSKLNVYSTFPSLGPPNVLAAPRFPGTRASVKERKSEQKETAVLTNVDKLSH